MISTWQMSYTMICGSKPMEAITSGQQVCVFVRCARSADCSSASQKLHYGLGLREWPISEPSPWKRRRARGRAQAELTPRESSRRACRVSLGRVRHAGRRQKRAAPRRTPNSARGRRLGTSSGQRGRAEELVASQAKPKQLRRARVEPHTKGMESRRGEPYSHLGSTLQPEHR